MEYVIKTKRLRNYLYCLGFNYRQVKDKTNKQEFIWLFENNELLQDAIAYYNNHKKKMIEMKNKKETSEHFSVK